MTGAWNAARARLDALSGWRAWAVAALLGMVSAAALPPIHAVFLLVPAFVGVVWMADGARRARAVAAIGWWFGFGHFTAGFYWIANALLVDAERYAWMIPFAVGGLAALMAAFPAAALWGARVAADRLRIEGPGRILLLAAAWTGLEWVRSWFLTGFPWNLIGSVWAFSDAMTQFAAVAGVYGLGLVTVAVAAMPATLAGTGPHRTQAARATAAAFAVLALLWTGGAIRLAGADAGTVPDVRLRLVQPNIPQNLKWRRDLLDLHLLRQLALSVRPPAVGAPPPTHVLWAETAAPFFVGRDAPRRARIARAAPPGGQVILGAPRATAPGEEPMRVWNSLRAVDAAGDIVGSYDKFHLVPFGEYVPLRGIIDIPKVTEGRADFAAGPGPRTLRLPGLPPMGPLICYEVIFPGRVVDSHDRPQWLLNLTNDAWYGYSAGPFQHLAAAKFRAVEEGLPVVRVAFTGISAVFDGYGRETVRIPLQSEGVADADLPRMIAARTMFARIGNLSVFAFILMVVLFAFFKYNAGHLR